MCMFCRSLFVLVYFFFLAIVLSVLLRSTDSDYLPLISSNSSDIHNDHLIKYETLSVEYLCGIVIYNVKSHSF